MLSELFYHICTSNSNFPLSIPEQLKQLRDDVLNHSTQFALKGTSVTLKPRNLWTLTGLREFRHYSYTRPLDARIVVLEHFKELWDDVPNRSR